MLLTKRGIQLVKRRLLLLFIPVGVIVGMIWAADIPLGTGIDESIPNGNLVSDAIAYRGVSKAIDVDVDISDIVKRYISVGDKRESVTRYLTALGFDIQVLPQKVDGRDVLLATRYPMQRLLGHYYFPLFSDKLRVFIHIDEEVVAKVAGRITYMAF